MVNWAACEGVNDLRYSNVISLELVLLCDSVAFVLCTKATHRIKRSDKKDVLVMVFILQVLVRYIACLYHKNGYEFVPSPLIATIDD